MGFAVLYLRLPKWLGVWTVAHWLGYDTSILNDYHGLEERTFRLPLESLRIHGLGCLGERFGQYLC